MLMHEVITFDKTRLTHVIPHYSNRIPVSFGVYYAQLI
jgi:hypothetical protein